MAVLVVGQKSELLLGHPDHKAQLADFGPLVTVPLRDPLTLQPLPETTPAN
jgi:hypothetical protein